MACVIGATVLVLERAEFRQQQARYREQYDAVSRDTLRMVVEDIAGLVSTRAAQADDEMRTRLRTLDESASAMASSAYECMRGKMTDSDTKKSLTAVIGALRQTADAPTLLVLDRSGGEVLCRPWGAGSAETVAALRAAVHAVAWRGEGFVTAPLAGAPGLWHVTSSNPLGWIITCGDNPDRFTRSLQDQTIRMIDQLRFSSHGYAWIMRTDGTLVDDPFMPRSDVVAWHAADELSRLQDPTGSFVIRSMIDVCRRDGAGFVPYLWHFPGERKAVRKLAYVQLIPQWNWIVSAGVYFDDLEAMLRANHASLQKRMRMQSAATAAALILILAVSALIMRLIYRRLTTALHSFQDFFRSAARERQPIDAEALAYMELRELALLANGMLSAHDAADERWRSSEEELRHARKMETVGRLVSGIAHDFNNLLTAILGYSDLVVTGGKLDHDGAECMTEIQKAGHRAASLTRQLLAFSRKQPSRKVVINLNDTIRDMERMLTRIIGETVVLTTRLDGSLCPVLADPGQIEQVLINLVVNARDAMEGPGRIDIETHVAVFVEPAPGRYAEITITDTGCGMSDEVKRHLFEPYFTTKETGKGTGLGLSIVSGIVSQSEGFIAVQSAPGNGTTFHLYFPCFTGRQSTDRGPDEGRPAAGKGEAILLVEDDAGVRSLVATVLSSSGYSVLKAATGREALELLRHGARVRLLVVDIILPDMTGNAVYAKIRGDGLDVAVLFISGYPGTDAVTPHLVAPGCDFLAKPFTASSLLAKVRSTIDGAAPEPG
jgi:signal transduction histidine kinase/ActR/RegA family two-component response regulator